MKQYYFVDVRMPNGEWWTVCQTPVESEAREFEGKQKQEGRTTKLYSKMIFANA